MKALELLHERTCGARPQSHAAPWLHAARAAVIPVAFASVTAWADDQEPVAPTPARGPEPQRVSVTGQRVTGSNVPRSDVETASPIQVITAKDLRQSGHTSVQEVLRDITANGQGTLSQSFSQAFASGASGIALRGLTVGATLVLVDGHRMAPYPIGDDSTRSFVDVANLPFDVVDRIEVLKDGASAIYGSDAIAGVVNIILKKSFAGTSLTADIGTSYKHDGSSYHVAGIYGFGDLGSDGYNVYIAAEGRKQNQMRLVDRAGWYTRTDYSADGGYNLTPGVPAPGNPFAGSRPTSATGYVIGPDGAIVGFMPGCDAARLAALQCTFSTNAWAQLQPATENDNFVARYTRNLGRAWELALQASYFRSLAQQVGSPFGSFSRGYQGFTSGPGVVPTFLPFQPPMTIPATNPSFPAGTGLTSGVLRYTFVDLGPAVTDTDARATRLVADLRGRVDAWDVATSIGHTQVRLQRLGRNTVQAGNLQAALESMTDPYLVGGPNSASVRSFIAPLLRADDSSALDFVNASATRELTPLSGGPLSIALGVDLVRRRVDTRAPDAVAAGLADFSNAFAVGQERIASAYTELVAPLTPALEAAAAVRYDHYDLWGGKASPKFGFKFKPIAELVVRGTASRGFRAPSIGESGNAGSTAGANGVPDPILCPAADPTVPGSFPSQCATGFPVIQASNPRLKPETSKGYTLGLVVEPTPGLSASVDFYSIEIANQINGEPGLPALVRGSNLTPLEQVQPDGSIAFVVPPVAPIAYARATYINANSTRTSGVDASLRYRYRFDGVGTLDTNLMATYIARYDLTVDGTTFHLAGTHGPFVVSGDTGNPRTRAQWITSFSRGPWQVTGTLNYTSSFSVGDPTLIPPADSRGLCIDALLLVGAGGTAFQGVLAGGTVPSIMSCKVKSFTTFDLYGRYDIGKGLSVHGSIQNLFNAGAPQDWNTYGGGGSPWNPAFHLQGAIGRYFRLGATYTF